MALLVAISADSEISRLTSAQAVQKLVRDSVVQRTQDGAGKVVSDSRLVRSILIRLRW